MNFDSDKSCTDGRVSLDERLANEMRPRVTFRKRSGGGGILRRSEKGGGEKRARESLVLHPNGRGFAGRRSPRFGQ